MKQIMVCTGCLMLFGALAAAGAGFESNRQGVAALDAGRYDEAIEYLSMAYRDMPQNEAIRNNLAVAYNNAALEHGKKGDFDRARDLMRKACELEPNAKNVKRNIALLLTNESIRRYGAKSGDDVVGLLTESLTYDDALAQTRVLLGQVYYDRDDYVAAKEHWEKALHIDSSLADVQKKLDKLNNELKDDYRLREQYQAHFKVRYEGDVAWAASRDVLDILENACNEAGRKFMVFPNEPLTVIIYSQQRFQSVSGTPDWIAGVYDGKIRIRQSDVDGDKKRLQQILFHEYMHALIHSLAGNKIPVWLNEGIAQCYEVMPDPPALAAPEKELLAQRLAGGVPDLSTIDRFFASQNSEADVQFAYAFSKAFVGYVIRKGWDYNLKNVLDELGKGASVEDAFTKIYFRNVEQMRDDWLRDLKYNTTH